MGLRGFPDLMRVSEGEVKLLSSIAVRIFAAPVVLVLLGVGGLVASDLRSEDALSEIVAAKDAGARQANAIQTITVAVATADANAARHLAMAGSDIEAGKLAGMRYEVTRNLRHAKEQAELLAQETGSDRARAVLAALADYDKAVSAMGDKAEGDRLAATPLMGQVDDSFRAVWVSLNDWRSEAERAEVAAVAKSVAANAALRHGFAAGAGIAALAALGAALLVARSISRPLSRLRHRMISLTEGDVVTEIPAQRLTNEIGEMAKAVLVFRDNAIEAERLRQAQEDERRDAEADRVTALRAMAETVEQQTRAAVDRVASQTNRMSENAGAMADSARAVDQQSKDVAVAAGQALAHAESVAAATEQLSASSREIGRQVETAAEIAADAVSAANGAQDTISQLAVTVGRIGDVAKLINDIASQTNLLALNATIEAARAGDAGKGFAVVANEVKQLANQTAKATEEISRQIGEIERSTQSAVAAVDGIGSAIKSVESISSTITVAVEQQEAATGEIARNVSQTSNAAREVSRKIDAVSGEATATGARAYQVSGIAKETADAVDELRAALIAAVRSATPEVDRRVYARLALRRRGTLCFGDNDHAIVIENISEGGLMATGVPAGLAVGSRVEIGIDGLAASVPAVILEVESNRLHAQFDLTPEASQQWAEQYASLTAGGGVLKKAA
jgi:methyl-accepting chemotaxis protein